MQVRGVQHTDGVLATLPATRGDILRYLKARGSAAVSELATHLAVTREAARQHLTALKRHGWVSQIDERKAGGQGRPTALFALTQAGDHLFPKFYDELSVEIFDVLADKYGTEGIRTLLSALTDKQVAHWEGKLHGLSLAKRIDALQGIYFERDPFTHVEQDDEGYLLVERNCPFLNLATQRPQLCSVTVSTLSRLLGVKVRREAKFQDGDRRCAFRVQTDKPLPSGYRFSFEQKGDE